ncbi:hypothetical protein CHLNCDRAFT_144422 [Chlorella variabilis]|uniref:tRNA/rRNA methyltransferase SpoU type domain-containing protein n=1 Tax=Chlorella variabilis TaxID=554065 RepID=E1ZBE5_CHLVA|nr:hypothetical protein CHLNCDRAFT_144422 [Chlorella variabilis]EFN56840.1 hypothetical protein CHLNCDRAFT_144422 [Chlorella variabilis]|eukprot:XP_005848942.1 hypothetical protein CHLNCDRAFT_144422 [Chlorella variabilis]
MQGATSQAESPPLCSELPLLLTGVRVVLVSPKTPANIGAVLRAAENFEAHDVVVVDARCDARCGEVEVTSCNSHVMHSMRLVPTLADALADCSGSIGFTRRSGAGRVVHASLPQLLARFPAAVPALLGDPQQQAAAQQGERQAATPPGAGQPAASGTAGTAAAGAAAPAGPVALVFGREESGLLESELLLCSHACSIPTGRSQPSLNLSHAVAVVLAQLFDIQQQRLLLAEQAQEQRQQQEQQQLPGAFGAPALGPSAVAQALAAGGSLFEDERTRWRRQQALQVASQAELESLLLRVAALLEAAGISAEESIGGGDKSNHGRKKRLMGHVRSLLLRSQASTVEVRSLHGLCKELERRQRGQAHQ